MRALIDADILAYEFGSCTDDFGRPLSWPLVAARVNDRIRRIIEAVEADSYTLYLTSDDKSNFRIEVATIRPYKGQRSSEKPFWYEQIRRYLERFRKAEMVYGMEADDKLSIEQMSTFREDPYDYAAGKFKKNASTVICSRDKDLNMVPGYHYSWGAGKQKEKGIWWQDEIGGLRCFYKQLLTGDSVDNIPGLYGVGGSSALLKHCDGYDSPVDLYILVASEYKKRFGSYWEQFLNENAQLLWMLQTENKDEIIERLGELKQRDSGQSWKRL